MDTLIQGGIGSSIVKGMWRPTALSNVARGVALAGPADKLAQGWKLLQSPSLNCPKGMEIDPPTAVGRYLG
eukprot:7996657-Pyramimonas_sp.AAC.1